MREDELKRIRRRFRSLEQEGLVQIVYEPETEPYEWGDIEPTQDDWDELEREGVWWARIDVRASTEDPWEQSWSLGMIVGSIEASGYEPDAMTEALDDLHKLTKKRDQREAEELADWAAQRGYPSLQ